MIGMNQPGLSGTADAGSDQLYSFLTIGDGLVIADPGNWWFSRRWFACD